MSGLDYDRIVLDPRELSYQGQVKRLESEGWDLEPQVEGAQLSYLRRHRRVAEILELFIEHGRRLRLTREENGSWTATLLSFSGSNPTEVRGMTSLEAAEKAWSLHEKDQELRRGS